MPRHLLLLFLLILCLAPCAGLVWLTHHPETEFLARAQEWPVVGPAASWFRAQYLPDRRSPADPNTSGGGDAFGDEAAWEEIEEPPRALGPRIWLLRNTWLRHEPDPSAPTHYRLDSISVAVQLERRGQWYRVIHRGTEGWVYLENYDPNRNPPYGEAPEPPRPLAARTPDAEQLAMARRLLGKRERRGQLGPYALYTNVSDGALLDHLHAIALQVEPIFIARYGRRPLGSPREAVVLYESDVAYRLLEHRSPRLTGLHSSGFNAAGLVVFFKGDRHPQEVGATFIHELVHLLNRRALGPALPPWLDEGLADDLSHLRVNADGTFEPEALAGMRIVGDGKITILGALSALQILEDARSKGTLPSLEELTHLDWDAFVRSDRINLHYATSAFFVRYLLMAEDRRHAATFRAFLNEVAAGHSTHGEALRTQLGMGWSELDASFASWLTSVAQQTQVR